jgi:hypothetical protein
MSKTVRTEEIKLFDSFKNAVNDTAYIKIKIDVEDYDFPETVDFSTGSYRKKWINNKRVYILYDTSK